MNRSHAKFVALLCFLLVALLAESASAQPQRNRRRPIAPKPLFRDPVFDGAADPSLVWDFAGRRWLMFYTNRRAKMPEDEIDGVNWVHGTKIGIAASRSGAEWEYIGTANFPEIPGAGDNPTYWAPEVTAGRGGYHMYLTIVPGVFRDWSHPRFIVHLTSQNLQDWKYESTLKLASEKVIDACVTRLPEGNWRMWYNNERDRKSIYYADSEDLDNWTDQGKVRLPDFPGGEGPKVFRWQDRYWMVVDEWNGLGVYQSEDATEWTRQAENLLRQPGTGPEDGVNGQHADVVAIDDRAYLFYFTHPGRIPGPNGEQPRGYESRRSSIQVAELQFVDGQLQCDRNAEVRMNMRFRRQPQMHDPSTVLFRDGRYWCFTTGMGVQALYSVDLDNWHEAPSLFESPPSWVNDVVPGHRGHFWAPDVIELDGRYLVYYSVSAFGKRTSAIALASSPTLDPDAQDYGWTDHGIVVQTNEQSDHNAIDPGIILTPEGELWMTYGSYWTGIKLIQLDRQTGKRIATDSPTYSLAHKGQIEAASLFFRDGYYYLFLDWGRCCQGVRSTYNIRVGRSKTITGPYLDREGVDLLDGGGTLVLDTAGKAIGPGHPAFFEQDGQLMLSYHYYARDARGQAQLGVNRLNWDADGWPQVDPELLHSGVIVADDLE